MHFSAPFAAIFTNYSEHCRLWPSLVAKKVGALGWCQQRGEGHFPSTAFVGKEMASAGGNGVAEDRAANPRCVVGLHSTGWHTKYFICSPQRRHGHNRGMDQDFPIKNGWNSRLFPTGSISMPFSLHLVYWAFEVLFFMRKSTNFLSELSKFHELHNHHKQP